MSIVSVKNKFTGCDRVKFVAPSVGDFLKKDKEYSLAELNPIDGLIMLDGSLVWYDWNYFTPVPKFQSMKFRVENEEHSRKIQEHLFSLGYEWSVSGKSLTLTDEKYLFATINGIITWSDVSAYFNRNVSPEYILKESVTYSLEKAPVEEPATQQINIDGQALTEQDVRDLVAFKEIMQEQFEKFGGK